MSAQDVFATAAAVIISLGGGGALVLALSAWLGRVWASRIMLADRQKHSEELEKLRDTLSRETAKQLEEIRHQHAADIDLLIRKRLVYERLGKSMRVFFNSGKPAQDTDREEFLSAYDASFLWAGDDVLEAVGKFLDVNVATAGGKNDKISHALQLLYRETMMRMRRDAGFPDTDVAKAQYRAVSFGDWTSHSK